jgi:hypothetical protein
MQGIKQIYGLFNVRIVVQHSRTLIARKKLSKLGTGGLLMANEVRDRLINSIETARDDWWEKAGHKQTSKASADYIADCLLDDGWIRPPMRLGQMCFKPWYSAWSDEVRQYKVSSITQKADGSFKMRLTDLVTKSVFEITPDKIGETVFLSKEAAEQKLKEMRGNNEKNT